MTARKRDPLEKIAKDLKKVFLCDFMIVAAFAYI